jgi:hypothetical protein
MPRLSLALADDAFPAYDCVDIVASAARLSVGLWGGADL